MVRYFLIVIMFVFVSAETGEIFSDRVHVRVCFSARCWSALGNRFSLYGISGQKISCCSGVSTHVTSVQKRHHNAQIGSNERNKVIRLCRAATRTAVLIPTTVSGVFVCPNNG